jgi:chromosome segregation protein
VEQFRQRLAALSGEWNELRSEFPAIRSEVLQDIAVALGQLSRELAGSQDDHARLIGRLDSLLGGLRAASEGVKEKERALQEQFAALQREINEPSLDLNQYRARRSRYEQLVKLRQAAANRGAASQQALSKAVSASRSLHELWRAGHRAELAQLEARKASVPPSLELRSEYEGQRDAFEAFLRSKMQGTGFRTASYGKITQNFPNGLALFERRSEIEAVLGGAADAPKLLAALQQHLADFLTFRVPDRREIRYDGQPIQHLSLGQRATALLTLLMSLETHPIVLIDQPEDDLDNETIFRRVVEPLLQRKQVAQFVIATHNPNLPVLGDAELVHACREVSKGQYAHQSGSLDSRDTRTNIVDIMEGGEEAFEHRQKIYLQWTNSPFAKSS